MGLVAGHVERRRAYLVQGAWKGLARNARSRGMLRTAWEAAVLHDTCQLMYRGLVRLMA
jgi:hypothetical protein